MRQIVLDTETTGLTVEDGHRIIEIGCLEIVNRRITGNTLHFYVNPDRPIDEGALAVHGITAERLLDEPKFSEIVEPLLGFVGNAQILIHNAPFDLSFLDVELAALSRGRFVEHVTGVLDTLAFARELHPGRRNSLDALCERYGVSNTHRKLHGALLDAELLADVYLAMTRGQESLDMVSNANRVRAESSRDEVPWPPAGLLIQLATSQEYTAHAGVLAGIESDSRKQPLWALLEAEAGATAA
jgi:DNA polymerase III subunit epsilon